MATTNISAYNAASTYTPVAGSVSSAAKAAQQESEISTLTTPTEEVDTYEKSDSADTAGVYKRDNVTLNQLNASQKAYLQNMQNMVGKLLEQVSKDTTAKGGTFRLASGANPSQISSYWDVLVQNEDGSWGIDPSIPQDAQNALIAKAKEDIGENGFYGVKQTSQRILDFAKAVTGGDPSKIGEMRKMAQAAFDDVARIMGGKLPQLSQDTYDAVMKGFDEWEASANATVTE